MSAPAPSPQQPVIPKDPGTAIPPPLRPDLVENEQPYLGRKYIVYKNPIGLTYFRLPVAHAEAARRFDGKTRLDQIAGELAVTSLYWRGMPREEAVGQLASLVGQLANAGLLRVKAPTATDRARRMRDLKKSRLFEMAVGQALFFKKSLFDPDAMLERIFPWVRWLYSRTTLVLAGVFIALSLFAAAENWERIATQGANFFTLDNLVLSWGLFFVVKIFHEFGHAFTCKRYGGEVHEMGFMFILFTPYLFVNVSDSWRADKGPRIAVTAAGIGVELFLASVATWLWLFSQPGLFNQMCFNTMVLCSVSTILFNGNPLMKFDGYYIMSDAMEIPNLRAKSNAWVTAWAQRYLLGIRSAGARLTGHEIGPLFGVYAVAAYVYGWFIMYNISVMMFNMLQPYGLEIVSRTYVGLFLFVSIALPVFRLGRSIKGSPDLTGSLLRRGRFVFAAVAILLAGIFLIPWHETIRRSAAIEHGRVEAVSTPSAGRLIELDVASGQQVEEGQQLGRIENIELESGLKDLKLQREMHEVRHRAASADDSPEARLLMPVLQKHVSEVDAQIDGVEDRAKRLILVAPRSGVVRTSKPGELVGRHFPANHPILEIGDDTNPKLLIALNEKEARRVRVGQRVRARFAAMPDRVFEGKITVAAVSPAQEISVDGLSSLLGGDVPSEPDRSGHAIPSVPHFEAEASLDASPEEFTRLRAGVTGKARIEIRATTLGGILYDKILDAIDPSLRL